MENATRNIGVARSTTTPSCTIASGSNVISPCKIPAKPRKSSGRAGKLRIICDRTPVPEHIHQPSDYTYDARRHHSGTQHAAYEHFHVAAVPEFFGKYPHHCYNLPVRPL